jgi:hypothetical protein
MAILKKRTSSRQIPEARGVDRAPLGSVIRDAGREPSISTRPSGSAGVPESRPVTSTITAPTTTKPAASLTTKTSGVPKTTLAPKSTLTSTTKPTVTNTTSTTPKSITTSPTSTVKQTVKPATTGGNSTSNSVINALTGAALGAGTKLIIDKMTGKPAVVKTDSPVSGQPKISSNTGSSPVNSNAAKVAAANAAAKKAQETKAAEDAIKKAAAANNPTSKILTDEEVQAELDKAKASEEPWTPPEGAIKNSDGTYTVIDGDIKTIYNADGSTAGMEAAGSVSGVDSLGIGETLVGDDGITVTAIDAGNGQIGYVYGGKNADGLSPKSDVITRGLDATKNVSDAPVEENLDETVAQNDGPVYYQDIDGNFYTQNADGGFDLAYYADGSAFSNTYTDDSGQVWTMADDGSWTAEGGDTTVAEDVPVDPDLNYFDDTQFAQDELPIDLVDAGISYQEQNNLPYDPYQDYVDYLDYAKNGGLITMMKNGGGVNMASGGLPENAVDNGDGTYTIGNFTYDMETDDYLYYTDPDTNQLSVNSDAIYSTNPVDDYYSTDSLGNVFKNGEFYRAADVPEDITSAGSGTKDIYGNSNPLTKTWDSAKKLGSDALDSITGALGTTAGAAGAGALIATLLGQDFSGGSGNQNQGLDMSKVGNINPRTTDFGIGPTRFVGFDDYGTSGGDYAPNEELLHNLNAPGYNPVNEGDYGHEDVPAEETTEEPKMASGGLSSMNNPVASYYTFGQPADIMANLGMRPQPPMNSPDMMTQVGQQQPAQQAQQQGLPQQAPPLAQQQMSQTMPQQGLPKNGGIPNGQDMAPPMRRGGLPHVSNVPVVQGRMDFRNGSAVHGEGDGQSDDIPAMLADGEYVIDAETVAQIGNGSTKAGAQALDKFREGIRAHKRSAPINKIPPKTKALTSYLKG